MTALETIRAWIREYPGCRALQDLYVDYTDTAPSNGGVNPSGLVEISRRTDILGNVTVTN